MVSHHFPAWRIREQTARTLSVLFPFQVMCVPGWCWSLKWGFGNGEVGFPVILIAALAAARRWASGRDPSYTSWADPSPGRRVAGSALAAPPHAHHCSCGIWAQGPEGQAASLPLPPDPWVLVSFYGGLALGAWATQPTSLATVISR